MLKLRDNLFIFKIFISIALLSQTIVKACEFKTFENIIIVDDTILEKKELSSVFIENSCDKKTSEKIYKIIISSKGFLIQRYIDEVFETHFSSPHMINKKIYIQHLDDLVRDQVTLSENFTFFDLKTISKHNIIGFHQNDNSTISCENCNQAGEKTLNLVINDENGKIKKREVLNGKLKQKITAIFPKQTINQVGERLYPTQFTKKEIFSLSPSNILTIENGINFFKSNKQLSPLKPLSNFDISPLKLVTVGRDVNVTLQNGAIKLNATAKALDSGHINQFIRVKIKNKILSGLIVGFNKVEIKQ